MITTGLQLFEAALPAEEPSSTEGNVQHSSMRSRAEHGQLCAHVVAVSTPVSCVVLKAVGRAAGALAWAVLRGALCRGSQAMDRPQASWYCSAYTTADARCGHPLDDTRIPALMPLRYDRTAGKFQSTALLPAGAIICLLSLATACSCSQHPALHHHALPSTSPFGIPSAIRPIVPHPSVLLTCMHWCTNA